jgi:hypothetical protein
MHTQRFVERCIVERERSTIAGSELTLNSEQTAATDMMVTHEDDLSQG